MGLIMRRPLIDLGPMASWVWRPCSAFTTQFKFTMLLLILRLLD